MNGGNKEGRKRGASKKPGDPDYKTPTQLRNARKRRKVKLVRLQQQQQQQHKKEDPSLRYLSNPKVSPTIQHAISFFQEQDQEFDVKIGPTTGWRTVAKLAVREIAGVLRIGLFVPGSHDLLEIPQCQAHHPRINNAIDVIQKKCRKHALKAFNEKTGKGSLKHVAINIERATGLQQVTLVWNDAEDSSEQQGEIQKLEQLCDTLIKVSKSNDERFNLHSLWIHYSQSDKHANSIFDREGKWDRKYGEEMVVEHLNIPSTLNVPLHFPPQVFRQANLDAFTFIIAKIRSWLVLQQHLPKKCLELYGTLLHNFV